VGSIVHLLRIRTLRKQIEMSRRRCDALAIRFETAKTTTQKAKIARAYDNALKKTHARQLLLELLERKERESGGAEKQGSEPAGREYTEKQLRTGRTPQTPS
jgi:hypothetical protein